MRRAGIISCGRTGSIQALVRAAARRSLSASRSFPRVLRLSPCPLPAAPVPAEWPKVGAAAAVAAGLDTPARPSIRSSRRWRQLSSRRRSVSGSRNHLQWSGPIGELPRPIPVHGLHPSVRSLCRKWSSSILWRLLTMTDPTISSQGGEIQCPAWCTKLRSTWIWLTLTGYPRTLCGLLIPITWGLRQQTLIPPCLLSKC